MPANRSLVPPPHAPRLLCVLGTRRLYHRQRQPSTTRQKVNRPIWCPLYLLPPNAPRPYLPLHCPRALHPRLNAGGDGEPDELFHRTKVRAWNVMDPFSFFMNPSPAYEVTFLNKLPMQLTSSSGKSSQEAANYIQRVIAATLSYESTSFTRKLKYRALSRIDGAMVEKPRLKADKVASKCNRNGLPVLASLLATFGFL
ncbi:hypothetical protein LguiB_016148 [Lonicera macranthoides]